MTKFPKTLSNGDKTLWTANIYKGKVQYSPILLSQALYSFSPELAFRYKTQAKKDLLERTLKEYKYLEKFLKKQKVI